MKSKHLSIILTVITVTVISIFFWLPPYAPSTNPEGEIRAALDIGSGATNLKIAKVDPESGKIITQIFEQSIRVPYQKQLEQSTNNTFDEGVMKEGIESIKTLKATAETYHVKNIVAVATAAFRKASNANEFAKMIEQETGVKIRIINQDEEGILAFRGALALTPIAPEKAVVWDIGGGSMQLTTLSPEGTYLVDKGTTASVPFKNAVIEQILHKDLTVVQNPNPLTNEEITASVSLAGTFANDISAPIAEKIKQPGTEVIAVGNLFNYGVKPLVNDPIVREEQLQKAVTELAGQTFKEISESSLAEVAATNPVLVLGYMKALDIKQVEVVNVNNTDGALTYPPYWS